MAWLGKPDPVDAAVLDEGYVDRLAKHVGIIVACELLADGMIELTDRLDRLANLAADNRVEEIGSLAHDIAGISGHLGLTALSARAVTATRACRSEEWPEAEALVAPMLDLREASISALVAFCKSRNPAAPDPLGDEIPRS